MSWSCDLMTDWPWAGGIVLKHLGPPDAELSVLEQSVNVRTSSPITLGFGRELKPLLANRLVIRTQLEAGEVVAHRIDEVTYRSGETKCVVTAQPVSATLWAHDNVRERVGSRVVETFVETGTAAAIIQRRVLTNLAIDGIPWLDLGVIELDDVIEVKVQRASRMAALIAIMDALKKGELAFRPDGNTLRIDIRAAIGSELPPIRARFGDRLQELSEATSFNPLYTGCRVHGEVPTGEMDAYGMADNAFTVTVRTGTGPWRLELRDTTTNLSPISVDGLCALDPNARVPQCAIRRANGIVVPIVSSRASDGSIVVAADPPVVQERVRLCALDGGPLERIVWPSAVAQHGLVIVDAKLPGGRGERNYTRNPGFREGATGWTPVGTGASIAMVPRVRPDLVGEVAVTKGATGAQELVVRGFSSLATIHRGDELVVDGTSITSDATPVVVDADGKAVVPLAAPLAGDIPHGTLLRAYGSPDLSWWGVYADGAANIETATELHILTGAPTKSWLAGDTVQVVVTQATERTVINRYLGELQADPEGGSPFYQGTLVFEIGFPFNIASGVVLSWYDAPFNVWRDATVVLDYVAGELGLAVRTYIDIPSGTDLRHAIITTSAHDITNSPTWAPDKTASVDIDPALPVAATIAETVVFWRRSDGTPVAALSLSAHATAAAGTIELNGTGHVFLVAPSTVFALTGATLPVRAHVTLDASGEGVVSVPWPMETLLEGAAITVRRNHDWHELDGGGPNVALITADAADVTPAAPGLSDRHIALDTVTILVPPGETVPLSARIACTFVAFNPVRTAQQYAHAKIVLVDVDTNTVLGHAVTTPDGYSEDEFEALSDAEKSRLELDRDEVAGVWLPLHVALRVGIVLSATTRVQARIVNYAGGAGIGDLSYASLFARYETTWYQQGSDEALPYVEDSHGNRLVLAGTQLVAANAMPHRTFELTLIDVDEAHAIAAGLPAVAAPQPLTPGRRIILEEHQIELRALQLRRTQDRRQSSVRVGRQVPDMSATVAALAVVSPFGDTR